MSKKRIAALLASGFAGLLAVLAVVGLGGLWYSLTHPWVLCRTAEYALDWPENSIEVETIDWQWGRFRVESVFVNPPVLRMPAVKIEWAEADFPSPFAAVFERELRLGAVEASGVDIGLRVQRPPQHRPVPKGKPVALVADSLLLHDSRFHAAPDPPFSEVQLLGIAGELSDIHWTPALKQIVGAGSAEVTTFNLGSIGLVDVQLPSLVLADDALELDGATFSYGRTEGFAEGRIDQLSQQPAVEILVKIKGSRVETAVEDAIGRAAPVMGWLQAELTVYAGGALARGESRFDGWVSLSDGYVFVGSEVKLIPKLLLDVAPWFQREDGGWLSVGNLRGEASFGRGWVVLDRLERTGDKHRRLQAWGEFRDGTVDLTVRVVPKRNLQKTGIGVRVRGPLRSTKIKLAKKRDLMEAPQILVLDVDP